MVDQRNHRSRRPAGDGEDRPARCHPTLFALFTRERLVAVEHRHISRCGPAVGGLIDPGCWGDCVGRRDVLPLSYLTGERPS